MDRDCLPHDLDLLTASCHHILINWFNIFIVLEGCTVSHFSRKLS